jgi:8-oxo-dGTP pyrophosphatase MutT (NUDIX family)
MSYLDKVRACNAWDPEEFIPWTLAGERIGSVRPGFAQELRRWPELFRVDAHRVDWAGAPDGFQARTRVLAEVVQTLVETGLIYPQHGESYAVTPGRRDQARCLIDRAAAPWFGVRAFGQHLNGFVRTGGGIELWVARRAANRLVYPLHLDNLVAGGLPHAVTLRDNLRKECREEADIEPALADRAEPVGAVTYCRGARDGLKPDVMYCYDLELAADFVPHCTDGEVESFTRLPLAAVAHLVRDTDEFKLNCNLVVIDFLVRHGGIDQEDPDYLPIIQGLRSCLP